MEQERLHSYLAAGPGSDPDGGAPLGASGGTALRAARDWEAVAQEAAGECESDSEAQLLLQGRHQRSGQ